MKRSLGIVLAAIALSGCGGGGSTPPIGAAGGAGVAAGAGAAAGVGTVVAGAKATQSGTISLSFSIAGATATSAARRKPAFISPNAATVALSANGGAATSFDVSATSTLCTTVNSTRSCTLSFTAPVGADTIADVVMSGGATPLILGQGSNSVTVVAGTPFAITIPVNPIVASLTFSTIASFTIGTPSSTQVTVTAVDPSGATITGSGNVPNFLVPITLTSGDPHVTLTPSTLTTPGQSFTVAYDGATTTPASVAIGAQVGTTTLATAPLAVQGLIVTRYNLAAIGSPNTIDPSQIAAGPDGNIWWTERLTGNIGKIVPGTASANPAVQSAGITHYAVGSFPTGIAAGGDGNMWYTLNGPTIYRLDPATGLPPATGPASVNVVVTGQVGRLATDSQGNVWYINGEFGSSSIGYVDMTTFTAHDYSLGATSGVYYFSGLTLGADNAMWFTEQNASPPRLGRVTTPANGTPGTLSYFAIPNEGSLMYPTDIAKGPDGNVWFSEFDGNSNAPNQFFAKFAPGASISITEYPNVINPAAFANLVTMFAGGDGNMYIAEGGGAVKIPPAAPASASVEFFTDNGQTTMYTCVAGPDHNNWCAASGSPALGQGFIATADAILTWKPR